MTNETQSTPALEAKQMSFGSRLKSTRESKGFDRKDAAAQLRLTEKIIAMMEYERYPADMPVTFIKGYIRAYGKLLQIPEHEVKKALAPIKPKPVLSGSSSINRHAPAQVTSGSYFMQLFTYLIVFTLLGLVTMWWYTHPTAATTLIAENLSLPDNPNPIAQAKPSPNPSAPNPTLAPENATTQTAEQHNAPISQAPLANQTAFEGSQQDIVEINPGENNNEP